MAHRRDRSNELIVAIVVIGTLALALTFGIILSLSSTSDNSDVQDTPTIAAFRGTLSPTFTPSKTASPTSTRNPTRTQMPITDTPTKIPTVAQPQSPVIEAFWPDTNVRSGPDIGAPLLGQIQPGTPYPVLGERFSWYLIGYDSSPTGNGWVYSEVVQLTGDPTSIPIVEEPETPDPALVAQQQTTVAVARELDQTLTAVAAAPTDTAEPTLTTQPAITPSFTAKPSEVATSEPSPTETPTPEPSNTATAEPTETPPPEPSNTPPPTPDPALVAQQQTADAVARELDQTLTAVAVAPTETSSPEPSPTDTATITSTPTPSATPTKVSTATPRPTATLTPTSTPTNTPTPTDTPTNTPTPTDTPTPTATFTPSDTPTSTLTPTPTVTLTFTPYPTLTPSITPFGGDQTATPSASGCVIPENWIKYVIQPGNTMFALALRFGLTVEELADANCIVDPDNITAGQILYVPPGSNVTPPPPGTIAAPPTGNYGSFDCGNPLWTITQPGPGAVLRGTFAVYGTATHPEFSFYRLQISGSGTNDADFATLQVYETPVTNGQLGTINPAAFAPGDYWLRLTVVDITGNYPPQCTVRVRFEP